MLYYVLTSLINAITSTVLGFFVLFINRQNKLNRAFSRFCFAVAFWSWTYCFWPLSSIKEDVLFWFQVLHIGAILIPATYLHFVFAFLDLEKKRKKIIFLNYLLSIFFLTTVFSPLFISDMVPKYPFPYWAVPGALYHFFLLYFFGLTLYCWIMLYRARKEFTGEKRMQLKYILIGTFIGFLGGSTNYFLWYDVPIPPYGNGLVIFYIILSAIAVARYHLFEMRLIFTEMMVAAMAVMLLVLPFLMPTTGLKILTSLVFVLFCFFGYYLIRAVHRESRRREDAETIASRERILRREAEILAADLRRLDRAKTQFLLSTQHHLRSPLSVINGYLSMIDEGSYGKITKKSKEKIGACLEANKKLIRLVDELLDVAHFQMNKSAAAKEPVDAVALAAQVVADLKPAAEVKNLYLKFKKPEVPIPEIMLNPRGIKEAIYNIVDNAIKYTQAGGVIVLISVSEAKLRIAIKDTGIGLNEKDREGLFSRVFERCERAQDANIEGKGIGLYLAAQIVANNGGEISVESEGWGKGSKFIIDLPMEVRR